jgi:hypothetical protein
MRLWVPCTDHPRLPFSPAVAAKVQWRLHVEFVFHLILVGSLGEAPLGPGDLPEEWRPARSRPPGLNIQMAFCAGVPGHKNLTAASAEEGTTFVHWQRSGVPDLSRILYSGFHFWRRRTTLATAALFAAATG